jgi:hypothetical protein
MTSFDALGFSAQLGYSIKDAGFTEPTETSSAPPRPAAARRRPIYCRCCIVWRRKPNRPYPAARAP